MQSRSSAYVPVPFSPPPPPPPPGHVQVPEEATLFFLPTRCTAYRKSVTDLTTGIQVAAKTVGRMVDQVQGRYPYWNASLGADHFYICAHDMGTEVAKAAHVGLWKNAIGLVNTADYSEPGFVAHKDVSLPPHPGRGVVEWALIGEGGAGYDPTHRTKLAFMAGHPGRCVCIRLHLHFLQWWPEQASYYWAGIINNLRSSALDTDTRSSCNAFLCCRTVSTASILD